MSRIRDNPDTRPVWTQRGKGMSMSFPNLFLSLFILLLPDFPGFIFILLFPYRAVCSFYEVLFRDISDPPLQEKVIRRGEHGPNIFTEFQAGLLFPNYNYPPPSDNPKPMKRKKTWKEEADKQSVSTPEVVVSDEDVEDFQVSLKSRAQKPSGTGDQFEVVARPRGTSTSGVAPVATMEAVIKEISVKLVKILVAKAYGSADGTLLSPKSREKVPSLSESIEGAKKRNPEAPGGSGKC
jgi:hypothetical protein